MSEYEESAERLEELIAEYGEYPDPTYSEADTRAKLIDRTLRDLLGWPETETYIRREEHVHEGFIDYVLQTGGDSLIIEAKRTAQKIAIPRNTSFEKNLSVKNTLLKDVDNKLLYEQVSRYAFERGIQFCAITNGTTWLIFPGVRTDNIHVRKSRVIAFAGLPAIRDSFLEFWGLLAFGPVKSCSLRNSLISLPTRIEASFVFNSEGRQNVPYDRNVLALPLVDVLPRYFGDLHGDPAQTEMLQECYVQDEPLTTALRELQSKREDEKPSKSISPDAPVLHFYSLPQVAKKLDALLDSFVAGTRPNQLQVLLGRVGIGKTTFLAFYFDVHRKGIADEHFVLRLDLRDISDSTDLESFFAIQMWEMLSHHKRFSALTSRSTLEQIFAQDIRVQDEGPWKHLRQKWPDEYEKEMAKFLGQKLADRQLFLSHLATYLSKHRFARFVLVFDNVDQLDTSLQDKVIRFAYAKSNEFRAFLILSMWEETYFASKRTARVLSTIRAVPMQITRQSITSVLVKRLSYLLKQIESGQEPLAILDEGICSRKKFCDFLNLILRSLLVDNRRVRLFLEAIAFGNVRRALETFTAFLTAGSLDTQKILTFMSNNEDYLVPMHEFVKCVMLGSKRYYSERVSDILNLYAIGDIERPSHFTKLRILEWLYERRHESTPFGNGFMALPRLRADLEDIGHSSKDTETSLRRLVENGLVEDDLRSQKLTPEAQAFRITPSGRYYLTRLLRMFAYSDLVLQDTPFLDEPSFRTIASECTSTDMSVRLRRCEKFIDYLEEQEEEERITLTRLRSDITAKMLFVPSIRGGFEKDRKFIEDKGIG